MSCKSMINISSTPLLFFSRADWLLFISNKAIPLFFLVYFRIRFLILGRSVGKENKNAKKKSREKKSGTRRRSASASAEPGNDKMRLESRQGDNGGRNGGDFIRRVSHRVSGGGLIPARYHMSVECREMSQMQASFLFLGGEQRRSSTPCGLKLFSP